MFFGSAMLDRLMLLMPDGLPVRHPDKTKWYGQPDRFSRDQLVPVICAAIAYPDCISDIFEQFYQAHRQRYFCSAWNTKKNGRMDVPLKKRPLGILPREDICGPELWALWIRYKQPKWARLVLWFLDIELLFSSLVWKFKSSNVTRNHMLSSLACYQYMPTVTSKLSYWLNDWPKLVGKWKWHCTATREYDTSAMFQKALDC